MGGICGTTDLINSRGRTNACTGAGGRAGFKWRVVTAGPVMLVVRHSMALDPDILERIDADFGLQDRQQVIDALSAAHRNGRITRCIVFAGQGSIQRIRELLALADLDDRDVIFAGEYDLGRRVRDLRVSFLIKSPVDFWISELATTAYKHGYHLTNLKTQAVSTPPFAGTQTRGIAMFMKGGRTFTIRKQDGQWSIDGIGCNLAAFGLDSPLADEERFRIQLDYLLSRIDAEQTDEREPE